MRRMMQSRKTISVLVFLAFLYLFPAILTAATPIDHIRATVTKVMAILKDPQWRTEQKREERRKKLRQAIYQRFDFIEMARRSLGHQWNRLTTSQREEFTRVFTALLERTYIGRLESIDDEEIIFLGERRKGDYAEVESRILSNDGREYSVNYRFFLMDGEWMIYDIVAGNISLVNNFRSQFKRILAKSSYQELVRKIRQKL